MSTTVTAASDATLLEGMAPKAAKSACDSEGTIGRIVLVPSSSAGDDGDVSLRIVTGMKKRAEDCTDDNHYAGCIVARRLTRFVPNETVRIAVQMSAICKDTPCQGGRTCDEHTGACVGASCASPPCDEDGGAAIATDATRPDQDGTSIVDVDANPVADGSTDVATEATKADAATTDSATTSDTGSAFDSSTDSTPPFDAALDPYALCKAHCIGGSCELDGTCVRSCDSKGACTGLSCPPGIPCRLNCTKNDACHDVSCGQASACEIHCTAAQACSVATSCGTSPTCTVQCNGASACAGNVQCPRAHNAQCDVSCVGNGCGGQILCCDDGTCNVSGGTASRDPSYCIP